MVSRAPPTSLASRASSTRGAAQITITALQHGERGTLMHLLVSGVTLPT